MKTELEIVKFNTADIVTASNCANPALPQPIGDADPSCPAGVV